MFEGVYRVPCPDFCTSVDTCHQQRGKEDGWNG